MCGIAGYLGERGLDPERILACLRVMQRRGPDHAASGHWQDRAGQHCYLLSTRLNIIDLSARANQPFHLGTKWLVYNGELYNYLELRAELAARGAAFSTTSDTEVLLRALEAFGTAALDRCEGMWAFALYDERDGSLALGRDRFGEKPLYLYRDGSHGLYFGSEVKCLTALLGRRLEVNVDHLYRYLVNGYKALYKSSERFFVGLSELPPATVLRIDANGGQEQQTYWDIRYAPEETLSYEDAVAGVRERLVQSVRLRLRADVPVAFCMSGGVDSNALIGIAKRVCEYDVHGFTITDTDGRYDERDMVACAVSELKVRHTGIPTAPDDFLAKLRELVRYHDAPVYTITYFAHWLLMEQVARHGYRIAVSGTAADELFTGYYDHHLAYLYEIRREPALHAVSREAWRERVKPLVRNPYLGDPEAFINNPGLREHLFLGADRFRRYLTADWSERFTEETLAGDLLRNRMLNELKRETVPVILHEDDLNAMYFSIENRSPYLDRALCEFCFRIPTRHLIRDGLAKAILRDAVRGIVPEAVRKNARKVGFNAPIFSYLNVSDPEVRAALLDRSPIFNHVRRDSIERLIDQPQLANSESKFVFSFLASKLFLEEFG